MQDNREVVAILTGKLASVGTGLVVMIVYGLAMIVVDPVLAAIAVGLTLVNLAVIRSSIVRQEQLSRLLVGEQAALNANTAYGAITMETIKAGGLEADYYARWEGTAVRVGEVHQRIAVSNQLYNSLPAVLRSLVYALVLCVGGLRVIDGSLAIGSFVAFQTLLSSFSAPTAEIVAFASLLQHAQNLVRRLDDVLDEPVDPTCDPRVQNSSYTDGPARLEGVGRDRGRQLRLQAHGSPADPGFRPVHRAGRQGRRRGCVRQREVDARATRRGSVRALERHGAARRPAPQ